MKIVVTVKKKTLIYKRYSSSKQLYYSGRSIFYQFYSFYLFYDIKIKM